MSKTIFKIKNSILLSTTFIISISGLYANTTNITLPIELNQNAFSYTNQLPSTDLIKTNQKQNLSYFKKQYFYPWNKANNQQIFCYVPDVSSTCSSTKSLETGTIDYYKDKSGYDQFYLPHQPNWLNDISINMDLSNFPNILCASHSGCKGIMINNAQVRSLPTNIPFYKDFTSPGEGYPFDYIQLSDMWLGTPVQLIQKTKDKKWLLVKSQGILGWVPANSVATVNGDFIKKWQSSTFIIPSTRKQTFQINQNNQNYTLTLYIGSILPIQNNKILLPFKINNKAETIKINSKYLSLATWPLKPNIYNFSKYINALSNMPYGWGGKDFNNDCSGLMRRLFLNFGIWLPRGSYWQANFSGQKISLSNKSVNERKNIIVNHQGPVKLAPYLTLVSFGNSENSVSHVGLYIGTKIYDGNTIALIFHSPWGTKITNNNGLIGRALTAKSLISSIGMGNSFYNGLLSKGWMLDSLWNKKGVNLTIIGNINTTNSNYMYTSNENSEISKYLTVESYIMNK
ncbi:SH3 domain-containing protein [Thiotrichales bacterium 19X7-9]|nr:SH3 domain-containing protein [Thiotrichales bacterium 19X7-9]